MKELEAVLGKETIDTYIHRREPGAETSHSQPIKNWGRR